VEGKMALELTAGDDMTGCVVSLLFLPLLVSRVASTTMTRTPSNTSGDQHPQRREECVGVENERGEEEERRDKAMEKRVKIKGPLS
jgi:hypothetical protein